MLFFEFVFRLVFGIVVKLALVWLFGLFLGLFWESGCVGVSDSLCELIRGIF